MKKLLRSLAAGLALLVSSCIVPSAFASYWNANPSEESQRNASAEFAMHDVMMPYFAPTTLFAFWQHRIANKKTGGEICYFYAGMPNDNHGIPESYLMMRYLWSFWHQPGKPLWCFPGSNGGFSVGEGASSTFGGPWPVQPKKWYRHAMRFWEPSDPKRAEACTYVAWWMNDLDETKKWHLLAVLEIPKPHACFKGPGTAGFIEQFGGADVFHAESFRNMYSRCDGAWRSCNEFTSGGVAFSKFTLSDNDSVMNYEFSHAKKLEGGIPFNPQKHFTTTKIKQPAAPIYGKPLLKKLGATRFGTNMVVNWEVEDQSTPQLFSKVELLGPTGTTIETYNSGIPSTYELYLDGDKVALAESVRVTMHDIFDQEVKSGTETIGVIPAVKATPAFTAKPSSYENGFKIEYYEKKDGLAGPPKPEQFFANWDKMPDMNEAALTRVAFQRELNLDLMPRTYGTVTVLKSHLQIPVKGLYRFHLVGNSGAELKIADHVAVKQMHYGSFTPASGIIALEKGFYPVEIKTYRDVSWHDKIEVQYEGPGISKTMIPESNWVHPLSELPGGKLEIIAKTGEGRDTNQVTFDLGTFTGDLKLLNKITITGATGETWVNVDMSKPLKKVTCFMPEDKHKLFARLFYKDGTVVNLEPITLDVKNPPVEGGWVLEKGPWNAARAVGAVLSKDRIELMCDGRGVSKKVKGDFVYEMRIKEFVNDIGEQYKTADSGLFFKVNEGFEWNYSSYYKGRFVTPKRNDGGLMQGNWTRSVHHVSIPCHFRFTRKGNHFKCEMKADYEKEYRLIFEEDAVLPEEVTIGPGIFQPIGRNTYAFFRVVFDEIKITQPADKKR